MSRIRQNKCEQMQELLSLQKLSVICAHSEAGHSSLDSGIPGKFRAVFSQGFSMKSLFLNEQKVCFPPFKGVLR